ncbi:MAG: YggU family protein [Elusimicrobia bacterium]|nr:YggU family protein [Elusimicrobiota bacterium]
MIIRVRVIPNAHRSEVVGRIGSTVRVKVAAPAIDGKANAELVSFLSDFFEVKNRGVKIVRGQKGKEKTIEINGRSEEELESVMETIP